MSRAPPHQQGMSGQQQQQQYGNANEGQMHPPPSFSYSQPPPQGYQPGYPQGTQMAGWRDDQGQPQQQQSYQQQQYAQHPPYPPQQPQHQGMPPPRGHPMAQPPVAPQSSQPPPNGWTSFHPAAAAPPGGARRDAPPAPTSTASSRAMPPPATAEASASTSGGDKAGPSEFIKKLYNMLEEESVQYGISNGVKVGGGDKKGKGKQERGAVGWGRGGQTFVVWEMNDFTTKVLPHTFRHSNFSSFVRQLNKYGFSKIKHVDDATGQIKENVWEFQHPSFQSGGRTDLDSIKRKAAAPKKVQTQMEPPALMTTAVNPTSPSLGGIPRQPGPFEGNFAWMESKLMALEERLRKAEEAAGLAQSREADWRGMIGEIVGYLITTEQDPSQGASGLLHQYNGIHRRHCGEPAGQAMYSYNPSPASSSSQGSRQIFYQGPPTYGTNGEPSHHNQISPAASAGSGSGGSQTGPSPQIADDPSAAGGKRTGGLDTTLNGDGFNNGAQSGSGYQTIPGGRPRGISLFDEQGMPFGDAYSNDQWMGGARKESMGTTIRKLLADNSTLEGEGQDPLDPSPRNNETITTGLTPASTGSPFGILELSDDASNQTRNAVERIRRSTIIPTWTKAPRVLVVEDDVVYRRLARKFLEKFGCIIETVEDAPQALEKMNEERFDLVLMDIFLGPSMDGRKATSLIRQFDSLTPIISMTSNAQPNDVISYLEHGMTDILAKPFTKRGLFTILEKHLIHLKTIQQMSDIPRYIGVPPLSDSGVIDAVATGAAQFISTNNTAFIRNPLAGMGFNDDTYRLMLQNYIAVGATDPSTIDLSTLLPQADGSTSIWELPGDNQRQKRGIEEIDDDSEWGGNDAKKQRPVEVG